MNPQAAYDALVAAQLTDPRVALGRSLHNDTLTVGGKIFAFLKDGRLVVKVPAREVTELLATGQGQPFRTGQRTMREWIVLPVEGDWTHWAERAKAYVMA